MTSVAQTPPLARTHSFAESLQGFTVETHIDDPLAGDSLTEVFANTGAILSLCSRLEVIIRKPPRDRMVAQLTPSVSSMLEELESLVTRVSPLSLTKYLHQSGLANMFPALGSSLQVQFKRTGQKRDLFQLKDYLRYIKHMGQVAGMCRQLQRDCDIRSHKYVAHQIALLYQGLNQLGTSQVAKFKKRIEAEFEAIKGLTENTNTPELSPHHKQWLLALSADVIDFIDSVPLQVQRRIGPVLDQFRPNPSFNVL